MSIANLSWEVAGDKILFCKGPRADCASLAYLSEEWAKAEQDLRADYASLAFLSGGVVMGGSWTTEGVKGI